MECKFYPFPNDPYPETTIRLDSNGKETVAFQRGVRDRGDIHRKRGDVLEICIKRPPECVVTNVSNQIRISSN